MFRWVLELLADSRHGHTIPSGDLFGCASHQDWRFSWTGTELREINDAFNAALLVAFATLSLVLAAVGLFGVMSYIGAQRTTEIGIRVALGAKREQVMRKMLLDGMRPAVFGLVVGLAASLEAGQLMRDLLYEIKPLDPAVYAAVAATLLAVAAFACVVPAWRASRLDPMQALRAE